MTSEKDKVTYPNQLKPCTEDLRDDELIRRLKVRFFICSCHQLPITNIFFHSFQVLSLTLQAMGQDDENFTKYTPLALHLVKDFFFHHDSKDVQLLVGCCIADILRGMFYCMLSCIFYFNLYFPIDSFCSRSTLQRSRTDQGTRHTSAFSGLN